MLTIIKHQPSHHENLYTLICNYLSITFYFSHFFALGVLVDLLREFTCEFLFALVVVDEFALPEDSIALEVALQFTDVTD